MTEIRITVVNESSAGGIALTPVWAAFHDGSFDLFDVGGTADAGLEALAEDGNFGPANGELLTADADAQAEVVFGPRGPLLAGDVGAINVDVDGVSNGYLSLGAMILPSNDAFIGNDDAIRLFDDAGEFLGTRVLEFDGTDIYDAGTEVNTEEDAAFLNQTAPNTGVDENGTIGLHPGFNGSLGNPIGEGDQNILGGTNAFGQTIDPEAADFTQPDYDVATIRIAEVNRFEGGDGRDRFFGTSKDDVVNLGDGNDIAFGRSGYDELSGGDGNDKLFGGRGVDFLNGGGDDDLLFGGRDQDVLNGGEGDDILKGGQDADLFIYNGGHDRILDLDLDDGDRILLDVEGVETFADVEIDQAGGKAVFDFGEIGSLTVLGTQASDLVAETVIVA